VKNLKSGGKKMEKELPENWKGTFFEKKEATDILNMTAEEFVETLRKNNPKDAKFFLAGAAFDFGWNGLEEKMKELIKAASAKFDAPYEQILKMISFAKEQIGLGKKEESVLSAIYMLVGEIFQDRIRLIRI